MTTPTTDYDAVRQPVGYLCSISNHEDEAEADRWEEHTFPTFASARRWMINRLAQFLDDPCEDCQEAGRQAVLTLVVATSLRWWLADVDGDYYAIRPIRETSAKT